MKIQTNHNQVKQIKVTVMYRSPSTHYLDIEMLEDSLGDMYSILMGDLNCHHHILGGDSCDNPAGKTLANWLDNHSHPPVIMNEFGQCTRFSYRNDIQTGNVLDLCLCSPQIACLTDSCQVGEEMAVITYLSHSLSTYKVNTNKLTHKPGKTFAKLIGKVFKSISTQNWIKSFRETLTQPTQMKLKTAPTNSQKQFSKPFSKLFQTSDNLTV
jgi:hypothetical protein